jgi:hypothetical protein
LGVLSGRQGWIIFVYAIIASQVAITLASSPCPPTLPPLTKIKNAIKKIGQTQPSATAKFVCLDHSHQPHNKSTIYNQKVKEAKKAAEVWRRLPRGDRKKQWGHGHGQGWQWQCVLICIFFSLLLLVTDLIYLISEKLFLNIFCLIGLVGCILFFLHWIKLRLVN